MRIEIGVTGKKLFAFTVLAVGLPVVGNALFFIYLYLASRPGNGDARSGGWEDLILLTNIIMSLTVVSTVAAFFVPGIVAKNPRRENETAKTGAIFLRMLIRNCITASAAVMGCHIIAQGARRGDMPSYLWLNLLPVVVFCVVIMGTFPTRQRLKKQLSEPSAKETNNRMHQTPDGAGDP